jgi:hypothetical protein
VYYVIETVASGWAVSYGGRRLDTFRTHAEAQCVHPGAKIEGGVRRWQRASQGSRVGDWGVRVSGQAFRLFASGGGTITVTWTVVRTPLSSTRCYGRATGCCLFDPPDFGRGPGARQGGLCGMRARRPASRRSRGRAVQTLPLLRYSVLDEQSADQTS